MLWSMHCYVILSCNHKIIDEGHKLIQSQMIDQIQALSLWSLNRAQVLDFVSPTLKQG